MDFFSVFPPRLLSERKRLGLSQQAAADIGKVSREMWGKYERGQGAPGCEVIFSFCESGADPLYLYKGRREESGGITPELLALVVSELQRWQIEHKKTLPPEAAAKAVLALLDLVEGDASRVKLVAATVLKLVA
jgi:transcriptional regulator with XRE-family HTH domain